MSILLADSYSESNDSNSTFQLYGGSYTGRGQSVTAAGGNLYSVVWYLKTNGGAPTGNAVAKLYTHSGVFGTSSVAGTLLATSEPLDVTTLTSTRTLKTLNFGQKAIIFWTI